MKGLKLKKKKTSKDKGMEFQCLTYQIYYEECSKQDHNVKILHTAMQNSKETKSYLVNIIKFR